MAERLGVIIGSWAKTTIFIRNMGVDHFCSFFSSCGLSLGYSFFYGFFSPSFGYYFLSSLSSSFLSPFFFYGQAAFFLYSAFSYLNSGIDFSLLTKRSYPALEPLYLSSFRNCTDSSYFWKSIFCTLTLPISSSSSITSIRTVSHEAGTVKLKCYSVFQTGISVFVSLLFLVVKTYSPIDTLTQHSMSPNVLVLRLNSAVSNLRFMTSVFSGMNVAQSIIMAACCRSKLRKHRRFVDSGLDLPSSALGSDGLDWRALRQGSRSMMPQPMLLSEPMLLSMSSTSRHLPQNLQKLFTMKRKVSLNLGSLPPFLTTYPENFWLENLMLTQGSIFEMLVVQCSMWASSIFIQRTPKTVQRFLISLTPSVAEPPHPICYQHAIK